MTAAPPLQWSIFEIDLGPVSGKKKRTSRPVLVVSRETANAALPIVTVLPLAVHRRGRRVYPNEVLLPSEIVGLESDTVAMAHQTLTIPKRGLHTPVATVDDPSIQSEVRKAIRVQLNLEECAEHEQTDLDPRET